jgi:hypothetical protein
MEEDVPEEAIKLRPEHVFERRTYGSKDSSRELSDVDVGFLLEQLALTVRSATKADWLPNADLLFMCN